MRSELLNRPNTTGRTSNVAAGGKAKVNAAAAEAEASPSASIR
jgi:hypothetical protein